MARKEVYFENHKAAKYFPWSLYHAPLEKNLHRFLSEERSRHASAEPSVLVIGPGNFYEANGLFELGYKVFILDIDPRVIEALRSKYQDKLAGTFVVGENFQNYPSGAFDIIYAKEVIEHLVDYGPFLSQLHRNLKVQGRLWLSTPNYGFFLLPLLEKTILELIGRLLGFSRRDIHPSRFDAKKIQHALEAGHFKDITIQEMPFKLSLVAQASRS